ncbi:MAG TPA: extracellular solute-binding protein [Xanthobacteraceae bacterium]|jgi:microcin C transport system substrate-binding protein|nr:extracellular solute-binding protein [Xanthobacteraceae bacterium]
MRVPNRRRILKLTAGVATSFSLLRAGLLPARADAVAESQGESHGMSAFGDLGYPPDFTHFNYVNPDAPKGGTFSQIGPDQVYNQNFLTFNSLNTFILKGDAAQGMEMTFAALMVRAGDEPDAMYGLAASKVRRSADGLSYDFTIRPEAKFHDGTKLTAQDVAFSLNILKEKGHPIISQSLRDFIVAEASNDTTVTARFTPKRARDVPLMVAGLPIFSRAYYATEPFDQSTLDVPLGSGPYKVGRFEAGRFIEYERVKDWWGADLPVGRGQSNFDIIRFEYYRDRDVGFEGFTAGNYLFREEFTSRIWATRYDFPAFKDGRVKRDEIPDDTPSGAQGWFINTRRPKFTDPRLREAINDAFDFEWTNKTIMYGSYSRTVSVFQNSEMMATGMPSAEELSLLEPYRAKVSPDVFGEPYAPPVTDGSGQDRALLRKAAQLLTEAGYPIKDGKRLLPSGEPITFEFLIDEPAFEAHHGSFIRNLKLLGIDATLRIVDAVQYRARRNDFDFDITIDRFGFSSTPGDSLRSFFSSQSASLKGSNNLAGIADPVVDALIDAIIAADSRPALVTACRALDRVIRAGRYWIPNWYKASHWIAYWDVFGCPKAQPRYFRGIPDTWWFDPTKAAKVPRSG